MYIQKTKKDGIQNWQLHSDLCNHRVMILFIKLFTCTLYQTISGSILVEAFWKNPGLKTVQNLYWKGNFYNIFPNWLDCFFSNSLGVSTKSLGNFSLNSLSAEDERSQAKAECLTNFNSKILNLTIWLVRFRLSSNELALWGVMIP